MTERASLDFLLLSNQKAVLRFMTGGERPGGLVDQAIRHLDDPEGHSDPFGDPVSHTEIYNALGNALRTARIVDLRLKELLGGSDWWQAIEAPPQPKPPLSEGITPAAVPGLRYARNAVEYDGADLIGYRSGAPPERADRTLITRELIWADFEAKRGTGQNSYRREMVGESILLTLLALHVIFTAAALEVAGRGIPDK